MAELFGWVGKILIVDLSSGNITTVPTSNYVPKWMGGRALAAKLYWDEVPPDCAAFDPENRLIFATGPAAGTFGPGATRTSVATKSPVPTPECYMYTTPGGHWGPELKFAGYDALVVRGKAPEPSYIWINDGEVKILKAERLWGMTTSQTDAEIRRLWGDKTRAMVIGPAGENLVRSAVILNDMTNATGGYSAFGGVMGSKNLKAIAVRGTGGVKVKRPQELIDFYAENAKSGGKYGGPYQISSEVYGVHHNLASGDKRTEDIDAYFNNVDSDWALNNWLAHEEVMAGTIRNKFQGCFACPACCGFVNMCVDPTGKEEAPKDIDVPFVSGQQCHEYPYWNEVEMEEFGGKRQGRANILNASSYQELGINTWCMSYHLDWFEDAVEAGLLTKENTGLPIGDYCSAEFAGPEGYQYGITYRRNDFFKDLAEGSERCLAGWAKVNPAWKEIYDKYFTRQYYYSGRCGPPSNALAMLMTATRHRGQPNDSMGHFTGYSKQLRGFLPQAVMDEAQKAVRAKWAPLLGPKSFDIGDEPKTFEGKVPVVIFFQNMDIEGDSIPYCRWMGFPRWYSIWTPDHVGDPGVGAKMLAAVTGIERTMEENVNSFEAAFTLERAILVREGLRREHDWYNDLTFEKNKDWTSKEEFNKVLDEYYTARGWDVATGIPTRSQLEKLGMKDVADDLESKYGVKVPA